MAMEDREFRWAPRLETRIADTLRNLDRSFDDPRPRLVDTTMQYAPVSGGVKRYLHAKRAWLDAHRPGVRHTLVVPGPKSQAREAGLLTVAAAKLPFCAGYRWPMNRDKWAAWLASLKPSVIEAGDPYGPGVAAIEAGQTVGAPVVGFCHSDPAQLAALHWGEWARKPIQKKWAEIFNRFDMVVAPSRYIAGRLSESGVSRIVHRPLGVDVDTFHPAKADPEGLRRELRLGDEERLLVFAGRPAKEKNVDVMVEAVQRLGAPYRLILVGAGEGFEDEDRVICLPFQQDASAVARVIASCDAFVHANEKEPFGLVVLEAMACGVPVVGVNAGGVAETVDESVGQLASAPEARVYARAISDLFERDLKGLGEAARERAATHYSWNRVFEDLCMVYAEVSGRSAFVEPAEAYAVH
ncbi:glycosyltransferase [Brevundimonas sp. 2R-24]|uniref:Glycosyltransferase n=1 Tax=Peiella sedimenti TaxID=3061083 RepID=A0ABT8SNL1_9CAUL|nr:glycosyltransferase [Caulobacteraceae bacterium XZ-24]